MIGNDVIQADIVALLKGDSTITDLLASASEVREANYMGPDWNYPTLRVAIDTQTPRVDSQECDHSILNFRILVFSDKPSSLEAQQIATAVNNFFHNRHVTGTGYFMRRVVSAGLSGPTPAGEFRWFVQCQFRANVYPTS